MSNQLQARLMNGTSMPNKPMNDISNSIKILIIILSLAAIPVVDHIPIGIQYGIYHTKQRFAYHDFTTEHLFPNLGSFVFVGSNHTLDIKRRQTRGSSDFKPSMVILSRILHAIMEARKVGRTALSYNTNMNCTILSQYLDWMRNKSLIESVVVKYKVYLQLTEKGISFISQINKLSGQLVNFIDSM